MKLKKPSGGFIICLLFNMAINIKWTVPAWILLVMHFLFDLSIWWFVIALVIWLLCILFWMGIIGWASKSASPDPYKENKNSYSAKNSSLPSSNRQQAQ